jgi:hypothetical protein
MVSTGNRREARRSQRRHRHRQGVVGIVLVRPSRAQHPHPSRQRRRHVQDLLAGADELLGQQVAEPTGRLDRPTPLLEPRRPRQQLVELAAARSHPQLRELRFVAADRLLCVTPCEDRPRSSRSLRPPRSRWMEPRWALLLRIVVRRTSFEPHPGEIPASQQLDRKPVGRTDGRHFESQPARIPDATDHPPRPLDNQSGTSGAPTRPSVSGAHGRPAVNHTASHSERTEVPFGVGWKSMGPRVWCACSVRVLT